MPDHGHGTSVNASVTANSDGTYTVAPLYFFMPGVWRINLRRSPQPAERRRRLLLLRSRLEAHESPATGLAAPRDCCRRVLQQLATHRRAPAHPGAAARSHCLPELPPRPVLGMGRQHARLLHEGSGLRRDEQARPARDRRRPGDLLRPVPRPDGAQGEGHHRWTEPRLGARHPSRCDLLLLPLGAERRTERTTTRSNLASDGCCAARSPTSTPPAFLTAAATPSSSTATR